jgi:hypothetical protein
VFLVILACRLACIGVGAIVARLLFVTKAKLAPTFPQVGSIEVPDTTVGAALPFHPGAAAYYNGDQTSLLEQFEDYFYLGAIWSASSAQAVPG